MKSSKRILLIVFSSVGKTFLVASLVLALGWTLVQIAEWKTRMPPAMELTDGTILLLADDAEILGEGTARVNVFAGQRNIGWWDHSTQSLSWKLNVDQAGTYHVTLHYSLHAHAETDFEIEIADQKLSATAHSTGSWKNWATMDVGELSLSGGNGQILTIKPTRLSKNGGVMNFVSLALIPSDIPDPIEKLKK